MMLKADGYLDENLPPFPGGVEERLAKKFGNITWNGLEGLWVRDDDDTALQEGFVGFPLLVATPTMHRGHSVIEKKALKAVLAARVNALVDHNQFGGLTAA